MITLESRVHFWGHLRNGHFRWDLNLAVAHAANVSEATLSDSRKTKLYYVYSYRSLLVESGFYNLVDSQSKKVVSIYLLYVERLR
jgi:hypothetical protein